MAIKGLQKLHLLSDAYAAYRDDGIKAWENEGLSNGDLSKLTAHVDEITNSICVGYGYDLRKNLKALQTDLKAYVTSNSDLAKVYKLVDNYFNQGNPDGYDSLGELADAINQYFDFGTETNASNMLVQGINNHEAELDTRYKG